MSNPFENNGTIVTNKVVYRANAVSLVGVQGSFEALNGLTPNQHAVAQGLDTIAFRNKQPKLITFLDNEPLAKLPNDLDKIAPEELTSIFHHRHGPGQCADRQPATPHGRHPLRLARFQRLGFAAAGTGPQLQWRRGRPERQRWQGQQGNEKRRPRRTIAGACSSPVSVSG
ncbi:MAG: hypothetical protein WDN28_28880 [Chthoniobacter sp.]